jgi:AGCS family alanine or glycine:cation symporter
MTRNRAGSGAIALLLTLALSGRAWAQDAAEAAPAGIDEAISAFLEPAANFVAGIVFYSVPITGVDVPLIVIWLAAAAIFFTFFFRFINFRAFNHAFQLIRGDYTDPRSAGEVSHFQALATALSGTVGLGNIAGVAVAISLGGPGATFWMILMGLFGMSSKFVECTLGVKYRNENPDGTVSGGPMYYLSKGFAKRGMPGLGKGLAVFFAIMMIGGALGGGNMFQVNQAFQQFVAVTGGADSWFADKGWLFGLVVAFLTGIVIIGGIKRIASVTDKLVPVMAVIYLSAGLVILLINFTEIPAALAAIFIGAFSQEGVAGGFIGAMIQGIRRATFSNEAGIGSAAIAHSAVRTKEPITEGLVALHEPFIDTVVICTMTALVIIISGVYTAGGDISGVELTSAAFGSSLSWFPYVLAIAVILFAFSTILAFSYYLVKAGAYLFGESPTSKLILRLVFLVFTVLGATISLGPLIDFSDSMLFAMALPNIIGLYWFAPEIKRDLESYWSRLQSGEIRKFRSAAPVRNAPVS